MEEAYDLVCVGFGPAALAVAVALHDKGVQGRVLFLERQKTFAWHAGMLLPSARMQISFLKDLSTLRDPRSQFTLLNYITAQGRLAAFTKLSTFLPLREEFNDYLTWVAGQFASKVRYNTDVASIEPCQDEHAPVSAWTVKADDVQTSCRLSFKARHVVIALGGVPNIPAVLAPLGDRVIHSSQYLNMMPRSLPPGEQKLRIAVIGGGQSAAEIYDDLASNLSDATVRLFFADSALRPSDDSPL